MSNPDRISWDRYFMEIAQVVAKRATCDRKKYDTTNKDDVAKKQYECKQDCVRGC